MEIPVGLQARRALGPEWSAWLDALPRRCDALLAEWALTPVAAPMHGFASVVIPVSGPGGPAALKVGFDGGVETALEHLALQVWDGDGAVRLLRADPARRAMLLEWLGDRDLTGEWDLQACEIVAGFYPRLHRPASPRFPRLPDLVETWCAAMESDAGQMPVPRRLVDQALAAARDLVADPESAGTLIHGDLHYENVLSAAREPWLVIDPQPLSGDPHYEVAPLLWNRWDEMSGYLRESIRRRFFTVVEAAGLDDRRARDWVVVRMILNAHWSVQDAAAGRGLSEDEREWITRCISVAKAVQ